MAGNLSDYAENKLLNHILGIEAFPMPEAVYVGLFTSNPTDAGNGAEVSGNGYTRKVTTFTKATTGTAISNIDTLFPAASGSWGTLTHAGIFDAATGGNLLWQLPLQDSKTISATDEFKIAATKLALSMD